jgi:hypothetical protein
MVNIKSFDDFEKSMNQLLADYTFNFADLHQIELSLIEMDNLINDKSLWLSKEQTAKKELWQFFILKEKLFNEFNTIESTITRDLLQKPIETERLMQQYIKK